MKRFAILKDIRLWIVLLFLIRLVGISNPPLERSHSWRQVTGLMVAKNYYEGNTSFLYPMVDDTGEKIGIIGMEFPIQYFITAKLYNLFGYGHWQGRLLTLIIGSLGLLFFYRIVERFYSKEMAFFATGSLAFSIWFSFSRKVMPDIVSVSFVIAAIHYALSYLYSIKSGRTSLLVPFILLGILGVLIKLPAAYLLSVLIIPLFDRSITLKQKAVLALCIAFTIAPSVWWYFIWNKHLVDLYGNWYNLGYSFNEGLQLIISNLKPTVEKFYFSSFQGFVGFLLFAVGLVLMAIKRDFRLLMAIGILTLVFGFYMVKSGFFFFHHNYYIIPFVPVMAIVVGYTLSNLLYRYRTLSYVLFLVVAVEGIANQQHDFFIRSKELPKLELGEVMAGISQKDELIAVNGDGNPQLLYMAKRKGWSISSEKLAEPQFQDYLKSHGCSIVAIHKASAWEGYRINLPVVYTDSHFVLYKLTN